MNLKLLVCFALLPGGCVAAPYHGSGASNTSSTRAARQQNAVSPPAALSATVIECIYQQGCRSVTP
ncbi:hypothetical protein [Neisseria musculi]|uniref:Lipoprotein n=1 Tax=Neisseria musculi TaxID=1815583 RepID=A0A7H1M9L6_9NEIS|nr:hypothetical protein [Neisseria musculi]QNT58331.1 hypothetical protein H7A79_0428 [Neisseria musculi]